MFLQQVINGLTLGAVYALVAVGYTLVYGVLGLINFAHGSIYTWGAFFAFTLLAYTGLPFPVAFLLAMAATALVGAIIKRMAYFPLRKSPLMSQIVAVLGISIVMDNLRHVNLGFRSTIVSLCNGVPGLDFCRYSYFAAPGTDYRRRSCPDGGIVRPSLPDQSGCCNPRHQPGFGRCKLDGYQRRAPRLLTFSLSAALAAAAGTLIGVYYRTVVFNMGYGVVIKAFVVAILGGMGNVVGAMLGGLLMGMIECFGAAYIASGWKDAFVYIVLILVLLFRPNGLLGT